MILKCDYTEIVSKIESPMTGTSLFPSNEREARDVFHHV
jgi:hypothetical protein